MDDLFKLCDVRGLYGTEFTEVDARRIGAAVGAWLRPMGSPRVFVGGDVRAGTPALKAALIGGLRDTGMRVADLGIVPTPLVYFAQNRLEGDAALMVTGSHNPPEYNGIKFVRAGWPIMPEDLDVLRDLAGDDATLLGGGAVEQIDVQEHYRVGLLNEFARRLPAIKVVVDPGGGCWSGWAARHMSKLGLIVVALHDKPDARFSERPPNCASAAALRKLSAAVVGAGAALGVAFDADGDRLAAVDERGVFLSPDTVGCLLLRNALSGGAIRAQQATVSERPWVRKPAAGPKSAPEEKPIASDTLLVPRKSTSMSGSYSIPDILRETVVYDIKCSRAVPDEITRLGARPLMEKTGYTFLKHRVKSIDAPLGIELGGHYYWRELAGADDGLYSALRLIAELGRTGKKLSELAASVPQYASTPELRIPCPPDRHESTCEFLAAVFAGDAQVNRLDGVRLQFENGWALVRPSVTEPLLTIRFEGNTAEDLSDVIELVAEQLPPEIGKAVREQAARAAG
jgi:phosphomannomutase/phosphoglucomutase